MILVRMTRDNYPRVLSKYYLFNYTTHKKLDIDKKRHTIATTISKLRVNCAVTGELLHRIKRADSSRCGRCRTARDMTTHMIMKCLVWERERE